MKANGPSRIAGKEQLLPHDDNLVLASALLKIRSDSIISTTTSSSYDTSPTRQVLVSPRTGVQGIFLTPQEQTADEIRKVSQQGLFQHALSPKAEGQFQNKDFQKPEKDQVSKENIEKALKSKPQRGKKRDDLNESERQELTRTRNREHAKSTRMRKKARYEALVAHEQELFALKELRALQERRTDTVVEFFQQRSVAFLSKVSVPDTTVCTEDFIFESDFAPQQLQSPLSGPSSVAQGLKAFDDAIRARHSSSNDSWSADQDSSLEYSIDGSREGIALAGKDAGFCEVGLSFITKLTSQDQDVTGPQTNRPEIRGLVRLWFKPRSPLLTKVSWFTTLDTQAPRPVSQQHPSVVSLSDSDKSRPDSSIGLPY